MANEAAFSVPMAGAWLWTAATGDTFAPSVVGASFAVIFRLQKENATKPTRRDLVAHVFISVGVGLIAGPYFASQLPDGEGAVGLGALIASFCGVPLFRWLSKADLGAVANRLLNSIAKK